MSPIAQFLIAIILGGVIAASSYLFRFLSLSGAIGTFILASLIFGFGGLVWTIPILTFFVTSSLLSKIGKSRKKQFEETFEKTDTRDAGQVAANGGIAALLIIVWHVFSYGEMWYGAYLGSIAAVTADTWGTEIGVLSGGLPRSIITFRKTNPGTSGAISMLGLLGGAAGACLIAVIGIYYAHVLHQWRMVELITMAGMVGSLVDSLLGGTIQGQYCCRVCGKKTEKKVHCDERTELVKGYSWANNDVVNWFCAAAGAVTAGLFFLLG
jgi:uncharacterized protein (TIGR00297 family)